MSEAFLKKDVGRGKNQHFNSYDNLLTKPECRNV